MSTVNPGMQAPPPPLPVTRSIQPPPTQVEFLLSQVRATLRYLSEIGLFDPLVYRQIHELLLRGTLEPLTSSHTSAPTATPRSQSETEDLGKKNAWLRKTLSETSILPTTVETTLSLLAGPLLSGDQKDAIVELVEMSQKGVAEKITDPRLQKRTMSGAKTAQSSTAKAVSGWSRGLKEGRERKKAESAANKAEKRREKEEKKQIKEELKRERNEMILMRQREMLRSESTGSAGTSGAGLVASPTSTGSFAGGSRQGSMPMDQSIASLQLTQSESSGSDEEHELRFTNHAPINRHEWDTGTSSIADTATLTVMSDPISSSKSDIGGTNTMFMVEPGLAISCSLVVIKGGRAVGEQMNTVTEQNLSTGLERSSEAVLTGAPPPPPVHPEVIAVRRQSSGAPLPPVTLPSVAAAAHGASQPPIPPRPNASGSS